MTRRHEARSAWRTVERSFLIPVAVVPMLVTQIFVGIESWFPWWVWSLILIWLTAVYVAVVRHQQQRHQRSSPPESTSVASVRAPDKITDLVLTVDLNSKTPKNLATLVPRLPNLKRVYGIAGPLNAAPLRRLPHDDDHRALKDQANATVCGPIESCRVLAILPQTEVDEDTIVELAQTLREIARLKPEGAQLVVDITAGTTIMSLVAYLAAERAGVAVTYTSTTPGSKREFADLIAIHDPQHELTAEASE